MFLWCIKINMYKIKNIEKVENGFNIIIEEKNPTTTKYNRNITYSFISKKRLTIYEKNWYINYLQLKI